MSVYKLFVLNGKAFLKDAGGTILNIIGIKNSGTGTGNVANNLIDWKMLQRSDTAANYTANNPVLANGEIAFTTDLLYTGTNQPRFKVGNGTSEWVDLDYVPEGSTQTNYRENFTNFSGDTQAVANTITFVDSVYIDSVPITDFTNNSTTVTLTNPVDIPGTLQINYH